MGEIEEKIKKLKEIKAKIGDDKNATINAKIKALEENKIVEK